MNKIQLLDLGIKDYQETLELQHQFVQKRFNKEIEDTLILVEHPHVLTLGRKANPENILDKSIPIYQVERGGDVTYHGPGQIVGYPIFDINHEKDIHKFLRKIEEVLIITLDEYDIKSQRKEKHTGVWIDDKKIASIGISFRNWVSFHGFGLNVTTDLNYFYKINPCGFDSSVMTTMQNQIDTKINIKELKTKIFMNFSKIFKL